MLSADKIVETWEIHNRINLYLLNDLKENRYLIDQSSSKGRTVGEQFAHIHNVRLMWLSQSQPILLKGLDKIDKEKLIDKKLLKSCLISSGKAISKFLDSALVEGRVKGFKPHPIAFLGYLISHESHHRGQIILSLKQAGHPISKKVTYGIWEWGVR